MSKTTTPSAKADAAPPRKGSPPARVGGRILLAIVAGVTALFALSILVNDLVRILYVFDAAYDLEVGLVSYEPIEAGLPGDSAHSTAYVSDVLISSTADHAAAKALEATAIGLSTLTFIAAAIVILLLVRRLWARRTFAPSAAAGLLVLGALTLVTAWLAPSLRHQADTLALAELDYPTGGGERWVELPYYDLWQFDDASLVLGTVLLLTGLVYLGARRLQHDTEGLI